MVFKWSQGALLGGLGGVLCGVWRLWEGQHDLPILKAEPARQRVDCLPWLDLECSLGGFRAEGRPVLGEAQDPRVEASLGVYCSGFIQ